MGGEKFTPRFNRLILANTALARQKGDDTRQYTTTYLETGKVNKAISLFHSGTALVTLGAYKKKPEKSGRLILGQVFGFSRQN